MSAYASPLPTLTAAVDKNGFLSIPFRQWLFRLANDWVSDNRLLQGKDPSQTVIPGYYYSTNGNLVTVSYHGTGTVLYLPFQPLVHGVVVVIDATTQHLVVMPEQQTLDLSAYTGTITVGGTFIAKMTQGGQP